MTTPLLELEELRHEMNALRDRTHELERKLSLQKRARRRMLKALLGSSLVGVLAGGVAYAANGNCPNGLPQCFAANTPAVASAVNLNFAQLKEWLEQKIGPVGVADVTIAGTLSVSQISAPSPSPLLLQQSGGNITLGGGSSAITVPGTLTLGKGASRGTILNTVGPLPLSQTFTTEGGVVMLFVSGSVYGPANTILGMTVQIDGGFVGTLQVYTNPLSIHIPLVPRMIPVALAAGTHTLSLIKFGTTASDSNDHFEVSFVELPL